MVKANAPSTKIILRVDDVGRVSGDTPEQGTDRDLDYFFQWREAAGLVGQYVVYGVVPTWLSRLGYARLKSIQAMGGREQLALHGWNHGPAEVTQEEMRVGSWLLGTTLYIPPRNEYNYTTIANWTDEGGRYFFGGFPGEHHDYGVEPTYLYRQNLKMIHLSAYRPLYGHAEQLLTSPDFEELSQDYPLVATLHVPWDTLGAVEEFGKAIRPHLAPMGSVINWLHRGEKDKQ